MADLFQKSLGDFSLKKKEEAAQHERNDEDITGSPPPAYHETQSHSAGPNAALGAPQKQQEASSSLVTPAPMTNAYPVQAHHTVKPVRSLQIRYINWMGTKIAVCEGDDKKPIFRVDAQFTKPHMRFKTVDVDDDSEDLSDEYATSSAAAAAGAGGSVPVVQDPKEKEKQEKKREKEAKKKAKAKAKDPTAGAIIGPQWAQVSYHTLSFRIDTIVNNNPITMTPSKGSYKTKYSFPTKHLPPLPTAITTNTTDPSGQVAGTVPPASEERILTWTHNSMDLDLLCVDEATGLAVARFMWGRWWIKSKRKDAGCLEVYTEGVPATAVTNTDGSVVPDKGESGLVGELLVTSLSYAWYVLVLSMSAVSVV